MRILVAEDEEDLNRIISDRLKEKNIVWIPALMERKHWII